MRVLLVTFSHLLPPVLNNVLNPALEYCAIVVDEPEPAKQIFNQSGLDANLIHPFYELPECISNFYYDFLLCVSNGYDAWYFYKNFSKYNLPREKFVYFCIADENFLVRRALQYYEKHSEEVEMFATGISYTSVGLDATKFKYKLLNFGRSSQDLYYDYQIAKYILSKNKNSKIRYALIGLAPYSFHFDLSKSYASVWRLLPYFIALNDLHNFWLPPEEYQKIFRQEYLSLQLNFENFDVNNVNNEKTPLHFINLHARITAREKVDVWNERLFTSTVDENIKILDDYLSLCDNNGVRSMMFLPPVTEGVIKCFSKKKLDEFYHLVSNAVRKHPSAVFLNGWQLNDFSDRDFYDIDHLNLEGAAKFSAILNNLIETLEK